MAAARSETLHCRACEGDWQRLVTNGIKPLRCPTCRLLRRKVKVVDQRPPEGVPWESLALNVVNYRLALEMARSAILLGRYQDALDAVDDVLRGKASTPR